MPHILVEAPRRKNRAEELEATDVHASTSVAFQKPDPEVGRGKVGVRQPKANGPCASSMRNVMSPRPRTVRGVVELAPFLAIEGFECPILKVLCTAVGKSEAESCNLQPEG